MKTTLCTVRIAAVTVLISTLSSGCATTVDDRIDADRERYDAYPPEVRDNIRIERIEPGYTEDMVRMALGDPDRMHTRIMEETTEEVWIYATARPRVSMGFGLGGGTRHTGIGTGVGLGTGGRQEETMRVIFRDGVVHAIEEVRRD